MLAAGGVEPLVSFDPSCWANTVSAFSGSLADIELLIAGWSACCAVVIATSGCRSCRVLAAPTSGTCPVRLSLRDLKDGMSTKCRENLMARHVRKSLYCFCHDDLKL